MKLRHNHGDWLAHCRAAQHALSALLPVRILESDDAQVVLAVQCPLCGGEHRHIVIAEEWEPKKQYRSGCGKGQYRLMPQNQ